MRAAIDFGISNTDAVAEVDGALRRWTLPTRGEPTSETVREILAAGGIIPGAIRALAVTGGRHRQLPERLGECSVVRVSEIAAIGRGGQALAERVGLSQDAPLLVVSAGSGTATVAVRGEAYRHVSGSGVGGGTLLGLSRLLLGTADPLAIDALALAGDPNHADLALRDVVSGPIGRLPADATAVNFGRLGREPLEVSKADLAASLVTLVGQVIAVTAINAARAEQVEHIVIIGHLIELRSLRRALERVGEWYGHRMHIPPHPGYATALGALRSLP